MNVIESLYFLVFITSFGFIESSFSKFCDHNKSVGFGCDDKQLFFFHVHDDGQLPRTICPGCTIQLEATVEFINLIINGQKVIRALHQREVEYKKTVLNSTENEQENATDNFIREVNIENGAYQPDHSISLKVAGIDKPRRKRGRPPKKHKTPEELALEAAAKEQEIQSAKQDRNEEELTGKRKRKAPSRFMEVVQGKELEKIFIQEGVTDGEESEPETKPDVESLNTEPILKVPEVIGHTDSGELVVIVKGKGRGRPKGRIHQKRQKCAICDKEFSCSGRYMSHVAQHGPVIYQCKQCSDTFPTRLDFTKHQDETGHQGQTVIPYDKKKEQMEPLENGQIKQESGLAQGNEIFSNATSAGSMPNLNAEPVSEATNDNADFLKMPDLDAEEGKVKDENSVAIKSTDETNLEKEPVGKSKIPCPHCDKLFSSKQSKSMHIKAVHRGERAFACGECGAKFAYPRALALHRLRHRPARHNGYACDLCGKVLNHPSSVTYHKEAEHAGQKFVCNKCGKSFKHKQLLQRHQLVHTQLRPFHCKICNATFKTKANLLNHQLLHSGIKKHACDLCKQSFAHKTSLTLHMRWHKGQKPYVCKVCGKAFSQKGNLSEHSRIHTGEKPFQCSHCPRRFTTSSQHRLHLRRHANLKEKPGAGRSRGEAARHERGHTGARPHACPHCRRAFADHSNLNKHKKNVHKQISLLASRPEPAALTIVQDEATGDGLDERVIYVTYDEDDEESPGFHLVDANQAAELMQHSEASEMYSGTIVPDKLVEPAQEHMSVTDEQGNPLHFTMQDGTQLAITSLDGQSLQVITQDGQTIPVEINGFTPDEVQIADPTTTLHQLGSTTTLIQKSEEERASSPITHYYTIV